MSLTIRRAARALLLCSLPLFTQLADAAISLQKSRLVFDGDKRNASMTIRNTSNQLPYLAQGWIEDAEGKKIRAPLLLLPPIQRIEPGEVSQIKIQAMPSANLLRQDQETLFYLNLREIPPKNNLENTLNITLQNRIKIFYRPIALKAPLSELASPWHEKLRLEKEGNSWRIFNKSGYYITLVDAKKQVKAPSVAAFEPVMLAPFSDSILPGEATDYGPRPVFTYINDYGGRPEVEFRCEASSCSVAENRIPKY